MRYMHVYDTIDAHCPFIIVVKLEGSRVAGLITRASSDVRIFI